MHVLLPYAIICISMTVYIAAKSLTRNPADRWNSSKAIVQCTDFRTNDHYYYVPHE